MTRRFRTIAVSLCVALFLTTLVGCEDEEAARRAEVQQQILKANDALAKATLGAPAPGTTEFAQARQALQDVINTANGIRGGESGQQAAVAMLLANAHSQLAALEMVKAEQLEELNQGLCAEVRTIAQRGADLQFRIDAIRAIDLSDSRSMLGSTRSAVDDQIGALSAQMSELEGPIADRRQRNEQDAAEVADLRRQANELMQQARESGYAAGFDEFERAVQLQRQADLIEFDMAQREIELELNLVAEHDFLSLNAQSARSAMESVETAESALASFEQTGSSDNAQSRQTLADLRSRLDARLAEYDSRTTDELSPLYQSAAQSLQQAAQQAQTAAGRGGRDGSSAANMLAARIHSSLGRMHWAKARGLEAGLDMYQQIADAGDALGTGPEIRDEIDRLTDEHAQAVEEAKAAYAQAQQLLGQVTGGGQDLARYQQNIQLALDSLEGRPSAAPASSSTARPSTDGQSRATAMSDEATDAIGFESAEALMNYLNAAGNDGDISAFFDATRAATPDGVRQLEVARELFDAIANLQDALREQFGQQGAAVAQGLSTLSQAVASVIAGLDSAPVLQRSDDRIVYQVTTPAGEDDTIAFVLVDGLWYVDGDDNLDSPEEFQQAAQGAESMRRLAEQIRNGTISDIQQVGAAMQRIFSANE